MIEMHLPEMPNTCPLATGGTGVTPCSMSSTIPVTSSFSACFDVQDVASKNNLHDYVKSGVLKDSNSTGSGRSIA